MCFDARKFIDYQRSSAQAAQAGSKQALKQTSTGEGLLPYHGRNLGGAFNLRIQL
jgi:hypothetical protein